MGKPARLCEVCGKKLNVWEGICTNSRCPDCHDKHCTPGGRVTPGHGRGTVATPYAAPPVAPDAS